MTYCGRLYAFRSDAERHEQYKAWLETTLNAQAAYGIAPQVLFGGESRAHVPLNRIDHGPRLTPPA